MNYLGIDPGFSGAFALVSPDGEEWKIWDMPIDPESKRTELDYTQIDVLIHNMGTPICGLEWNTTRPENEPERAYRFGMQTGALAMALSSNHINWKRVSPVAWKGKFGIRGKEHDPKSESAREFWHNLGLTPEIEALVYGPRGGLLDGRLDAALIAEYTRRESIGFVTETIRRYGKKSDKAAMAVWTSGPGGRPGGKRLPRI